MNHARAALSASSDRVSTDLIAQARLASATGGRPVLELLEEKSGLPRVHAVGALPAASVSVDCTVSLRGLMPHSTSFPIGRKRARVSRLARCHGSVVAVAIRVGHVACLVRVAIEPAFGGPDIRRPAAICRA